MGCLRSQDPKLIFHQREGRADRRAERDVLRAAQATRQNSDRLALSVEHWPSAVAVIGAQVELNEIMAYSADDAG